MNESRLTTGVAVVLIVLVVTLRLLPHPANFAPVAAVAIFGGAVLPRRVALCVPLVAMMASDLIIGFYGIMPIVWACYALIVLSSSIWLRRQTMIRGVVLTLGASMFFFTVTNFAVWAASGMYAHTWFGLMHCYAMALPFFRNTMLSDSMYTSALFAALAFSKRLYRPIAVSAQR